MLNIMTRHKINNSDLKHIEYEYLYAEILENSKKIYQVINICVVGTAGNLGYAFTLFESIFIPLLFLLPFVIIIPSIINIIS